LLLSIDVDEPDGTIFPAIVATLDAVLRIVDVRGCIFDVRVCIILCINIYCMWGFIIGWTSNVLGGHQMSWVDIDCLWPTSNVFG